MHLPGRKSHKRRRTDAHFKDHREARGGVANGVSFKKLHKQTKNNQKQATHQPNISQTSTKTKPRQDRKTTKTQPKSNQKAAKTQPNRDQKATIQQPNNTPLLQHPPLLSYERSTSSPTRSGHQRKSPRRKVHRLAPRGAGKRRPCPNSNVPRSSWPRGGSERCRPASMEHASAIRAASI